MAQKKRLDPDWPFLDPKNVAVYTTSDIMNRCKPILRVTHDADDGAWQFHIGKRVSTKDGKMLALSTIVKIDPSILELADLPEGWIAERESPKDPWRRFKYH